MQYKFILRFNGRTTFYSSYDEAMKMARWCGAKMSDIKEAHVF